MQDKPLSGDPEQRENDNRASREQSGLPANPTDERQDSIRQGIGAPQESAIGQKAAAEHSRLAADGSEIGGGMGGTSDSDSPADEASKNAELNRNNTKQ